MKKLKLKVHNHAIDIPENLSIADDEDVYLIIKKKDHLEEQKELYRQFLEEDRQLAEEGLEDYHQMLSAEN